MLTFAYGSNMLLQKLKINMPSAKKVANGYITGYRFSFNKVSKKDGSAKGNIVYTGNNDDIVWGIIYEISEEEKKALDREEGLGRGYRQEVVSITTSEGNEMDALAYIADIRAIRNGLLPFDWYRDMVITGAKKNGLPEDSITALENFKYKFDNDEERRKLKYQIIHQQD